MNAPRRRSPFRIEDEVEYASDANFRKDTLKVLGKQGVERVVKEDGSREEKAMDGTNKDCTSGQKTRCPSAIPDGFKSPLISAASASRHRGNITTH